MRVDTVKVELIDWIARLNDRRTISKIMELKNKENKVKDNTQTKLFGAGKHLIENVSDDFNDPLDMFNDYVK